MPKLAFRFLVDEDLHRDIARFLTSEGHDVSIVPKGAKNGSVYRLALSSSSILLTGDKDFSNSLLYPTKPTKGIVLVRLHPLDPSLVIPFLRTLIQSTTPKRLKGKLVLLEPDGIRIR